MESMEKVQKLEREIEVLKLKVEDLEAGLKNAEMRINSMSTSHFEPAKEPSSAYRNPEAVESAPIPAATYNSTESVQQTPNTTGAYTYGASAKPTPTGAYSYAANANPAAYGRYSNASAPQNMQQAASYQNMQRPAAPRQNSSTESWIGKVLMGALASLLVFIALITFAKLLMPFITDTIKIILMFAASIVLTATGFVLSKKKPENTFFKALLACGSACIYLSILVTGIHFKAITSLVMYVLLAIWAISMFFLKESKNDWLFFSIGNLGYLVSIMFTTGLDDKLLIIPMLIYVVMISTAYLIMYWKNPRLRTVQSILGIASLILFQIIISINFGEIAEVCIVGAVAMFCGFAGFITYVVADIMSYKKDHFYLSALYTGAYIFAYFILHLMIDFPVFFSFAVVLIPAIVYEVLNAFWRSCRVSENECVVNAIFSGILFSLAAFIIAFDDNILFKSGIIMIVYSIVAIYGFMKKDDFFKINGWILVAICMGIGYIENAGLFFTLVATLLSLSALVVEGYVLNTSVPFKVMSYLSFIGCLIAVGSLMADLPALKSSDEIVYLGTFGVTALINLILTLTGFYRTKAQDNGKAIHLIMDVVNLFLMLYGAGTMSFVDSKVLKLIYAVIVFALACVNLPVKGKGSRGRYLYTGLKFGFLLCYSLWVFETPSFVISIIMIAFAVICIALGFRIRSYAKELRVFGLLTTLAFVFKFIVIDISFDSSVLKALSYLIAGILCFGISAIYNHFEKTTAQQYRDKQPQQFQQSEQQTQQYQQPQQ